MTWLRRDGLRLLHRMYDRRIAELGDPTTETPVPDEWVTAVASLDVAGPPDELTVLFSLNTEIVSGVAPGPMWEVHGLWNRNDGVLEDEHELDRGAWVVQ